MPTKIILFVLFLQLSFFVGANCYAQSDTSAAARIKEVPAKYFNEVNKKVDKYKQQMTDKTEKTLVKLSRYETKVRNFLHKVSPDEEQRLFGNGQMTFNSLLQQMQSGSYNLPANMATNNIANYNSYRDTLTTALKYFNQEKQYLDTGTRKNVSGLNDNMQQLNLTEDTMEVVKQFIKQRKKQLIDGSITYMGNSKYLMGMNKESYYYVQSMKNYKETFSDPGKLDTLIMGELTKMPAFQNFFKSNSMLSSLFPTPGNDGTSLALAGLQTRSQVNQVIQGQVGSGGANAQAVFNQGVQQAESMESQLKDKIATYGEGGQDIDTLNFKPNNQRTKTFLKRLEYGTDLQTQQSSSYFPTTTDIGLSIGYKLTDKNSVGIGASYKIGWGNGIQQVSISGQGVSLRSFIDINIKKSFYVSGGLEYNYQQPFQFQQIPGLNSWQQSGLIGISKIVSMNTKFFKKTKIQLFWDFLSYEQTPKTNPIKFRIGYNF